MAGTERTLRTRVRWCCAVAVWAACVPAGYSGAASAATDELAISGRWVAAGETPDERMAAPKGVPPGAPPLLSFRIFEAQQTGRAGSADLMLDDAGH